MQHSTGYAVRPELRRTIVFAPHDVLSDAPFSRVDLVTCRNLLIYLTPRAQQSVLRRLSFSLNVGGGRCCWTKYSLKSNGS